MTVHLFWFQLPIGAQETFMWAGHSWISLLRVVGQLLQCMEWWWRLGIHRMCHRCEGSGVFYLAKLAFLHSFPVEIVVALGGLYQFSKVVGFAKYGNFILEAVGKAIIELKMKAPVSPVNACSECVEMNQIFCQVSIMIHE